MVSVGDYSKELCGGTHVKNTKEIGLFRITSEQSIASGVRRIEAVTGTAANKKIKEEKELVKEIASELKTQPKDILKEIEKASKKIKDLERALEEFSVKSVQSNIDGILENSKNIKGLDVVIAEIKNADMALLRKSADALKARLKKPVVVLVSEKDGKFSMVSSTNLAINAVKILNDTGSAFGIKGGGRPDFAQAGARSGIDIRKILKKAEEVIEGYL